MYIAKSKIHIQTKRKGRKQYSSKNKYKGYLYLDVDSNNSINMNLRINDKRNSIKVKIPKYAVYDMLIYHLSFRPIRKPKDAIVYTNDKVEAFKPEMDFAKLTPDEIKIEYEKAIENLRNEIKKATVGVRMNRAQKQLNALVDAQWKIELYRAIWKGKNFKIE